MHGWVRARQKAQRLHALQSKPHVQAQSMEVFLQAVQYTQAQKHRDFRESPGSCPGSFPAKDHSRQNARQRQRSIHESSAVLHSPRRRGYGCRRSGGRASFVVFVVRHATGIGTGSVEGRCVKKMHIAIFAPMGKCLYHQGLDSAGIWESAYAPRGQIPGDFAYARLKTHRLKPFCLKIY